MLENLGYEGGAASLTYAATKKMSEYNVRVLLIPEKKSNCSKTVILTGSQVPLAEIRNDAVENLLGALTIAGHFVIPEVCLYFNNKLFRGNRVTKLDATDFNAFDSPNMRPLVTVGVNIAHVCNLPVSLLPLRHVSIVFRNSPGITESTVRASMAPPIQGVVLESYGAGNAPDCREDLMRALKDASDRGVVIVNCTQCKRGMVTDACVAFLTDGACYTTVEPPESPFYHLSSHLTHCLRVPMTDGGNKRKQKCALVKLSFVLGCNNTPGECRALLRQSLRGELTVPSPKLRFAYNGDYLSLLQAIVAAAMGHASPESREMAVVLAQNVASNIPNHERLLIEKDLYAFLLCAAAKADDVEGLKMLENTAGHHLQMNCVDYDGRTPLVMFQRAAEFAFRGRLMCDDIVDGLSFSASWVTNAFFSPFQHVASSEGHERCVEFLLRSGASVHVRDRWGHTALFDATRFRHPDVVRLLRETGAHFNGDEIDEVAERVCTAAAVGDVSMLKVCIAAGADVNRTGWDQRTALHAVWASPGPIPPCTPPFLFFWQFCERATANAKFHFSFHCAQAAQEGRAESIAYLLSLPETDPSPSDRWGRTPLDVARHAVTLGSTLAEEVVRMLVEATAAAQRRRDSERTAGEPRSLAGIVGDCWIE
ncbi:MAG: asparaginase-domain-containing protein [Olpidium bornovanus]|uniref:asparaginase n=1 Tax=Olpidium bornovanus TaxID=278681 RepID=A0A8H8DJM3_9FUNG|nr:MAG: asparaginase-domain-containing protein [Olpidium bornovanus]